MNGFVRKNNKFMNDIGHLKIDESFKNLVKDSWIMEKINKTEKFLKSINKSVDCIYVDMGTLKVGILNIIYFDGVLFYAMPMTILDNVESVKKNFLRYEKMYLDAYNSGKFYEISDFIDKKNRPAIFNLFYNKMNSENKFKSFVNTHKVTDYALMGISTKVIEEIQNMVPEELVKKRIESKLVDEDGYIKIYRGVCSESSRGKKAISWTRDYEIAKDFATRFSKKGTILSGKIHINDILFIYEEEMWYIEGEEDEDYEDVEKEILLNPKKVIDLKKETVVRD
ncbi:hypothetical protein ONV75_16575 [Clostridium sp. LQ25]|jgi:hypothetical protein|uniref:hypothetical protein n=1 Tax=Clostridium sp. LQ25 TaxID=2992805 RepID=UPI002252AB30|nr:hypothetical protein [Clostridium sp. LQ25]UZT06196.1 hypothetical protein ONV75_16575 [Clostridium sp. LQ25]